MAKNEFGRRSDSLKEAPPSLNQVIPAHKTKDPSTNHRSVGRPDEKLAKMNRAKKISWINLDHATIAREPERTSTARPDDTDLERRVLAHERILQTLIAHMAETEPKFLLRLTDTFCVPMKMERHEQDYTDTDSYAEEFIRSVAGLGRKSAKKGSKRLTNSRSRYLPSAGRKSFKIAPSPFHIEHEGVSGELARMAIFTPIIPRKRTLGQLSVGLSLALFSLPETLIASFFATAHHR